MSETETPEASETETEIPEADLTPASEVRFTQLPFDEGEGARDEDGGPTPQALPSRLFATSRVPEGFDLGPETADAPDTGLDALLGHDDGAGALPVELLGGERDSEIAALVSELREAALPPPPTAMPASIGPAASVFGGAGPAGIIATAQAQVAAEDEAQAQAQRDAPDAGPAPLFSGRGLAAGVLPRAQDFSDWPDPRITWPDFLRQRGIPDHWPPTAREWADFDNVRGDLDDARRAMAQARKATARAPEAPYANSPYANSPYAAAADDAANFNLPPVEPVDVGAAPFADVNLDSPLAAASRPLVAPQTAPADTSTPLWMKEATFDKSLCRRCKRGWETVTAHPSQSYTFTPVRYVMLCTATRTPSDVTQTPVFYCTMFEPSKKKEAKLAEGGGVRGLVARIRAAQALTAPPPVGGAKPGKGS